MKLALWQGPALGADEAAALGAVARALGAAAQMGAACVVFPELFLPGYNQFARHHDLAQPMGGAWEARLSQLCRTHGCGLAIGWAERDGAQVYNTATCHDHTGALLARYRKIQLFGPNEQAVFTPGAGYTLFQLGPFRAALLICYDIEFAAHARALADLGAELVLVPTANPAGFSVVSSALVPARAAEAGLVIAYANYCGAEGDLAYDGNSVIVDGNGATLARAGQAPALLVVDLAGLPAPLTTQSADFRSPVQASFGGSR